MRYVPCWKQIGISKDRYIELLHFCRQYPEWKIEANSLLGIRGMTQDGQPRGTGKTDPVATTAERRENLTRKIDMVDECAKKVKGGEWYAALIQNVCMGRSYAQLDATIMPTSFRQAFFSVRREFFAALDKLKDEKEIELHGE
jgi:hypothetical protein